MSTHQTARNIPLLILLAVATPCSATILTPGEKNLQALTETAVLAHSMIAEEFGFLADQILSFTGSFDASGWTLNMLGTPSTPPVSLTFTASSDPAGSSGTYTSTGTAAGADWTSTGSWTFTDPDADTSLMDFDSEAAFSLGDGFPKIRDKHIIEKKFFVAGGAINDVGQVQTTFFRIPFGQPKPERSRFVIPPIPVPFPPFIPLFATITIEGDTTLTADGVLNPSGDSGTITGNTSTVPEPSGLILCGTVLLGILDCHRRAAAAGNAKTNNISRQ